MNSKKCTCILQKNVLTTFPSERIMYGFLSAFHWNFHNLNWPHIAEESICLVGLKHLTKTSSATKWSWMSSTTCCPGESSFSRTCIEYKWSTRSWLQKVLSRFRYCWKLKEGLQKFRFELEKYLKFVYLLGPAHMQCHHLILFLPAHMQCHRLILFLVAHACVPEQEELISVDSCHQVWSQRQKASAAIAIITGVHPPL